jgi:hypothetical protein
VGWLRVGKRWKGYGWEKGEGLRVGEKGRRVKGGGREKC